MHWSPQDLQCIKLLRVITSCADAFGQRLGLRLSLESYATKWAEKIGATKLAEEYIAEVLNREKWEEPIYIQPLVRCRECVYFARNYVQVFDGKSSNRVVAHNVCIRDLNNKLYVKNDKHFCSWGAKK